MHQRQTLGKLAKVLGMLGSEHDGEVLNAAKQVEKSRKELDTNWEVILGLAPE